MHTHNPLQVHQRLKATKISFQVLQRKIYIFFTSVLLLLSFVCSNVRFVVVAGITFQKNPFLSTGTAKTLKDFNEKEAGLHARRDFYLPYLFCIACCVLPQEQCKLRKSPIEDSQKTPLGCYYGCCLCPPSRLVFIRDARTHQVSNLGVNVSHYHFRNPTTSL